MSVRLFDPASDDFEKLAALHGAAFDPPWSAHAIAELLVRPACFAFVAGDAPDGFIIVQVAADEAEVLTLVVARDQRRKGLGRLLVEAGAAAATASGARMLFLEVDAENAPAVALYETLGFNAVGRRSSYYERRGKAPSDAVILKAALPLPRMGKGTRPQ